MAQKKLVTEDTENVVPIDPSKPISRNGGGGNGGLIAHRLGGVEQRVAMLESKIDDIRITCAKISTKMEEVPSKSYVLRHTIAIGVAVIMILGAFVHFFIRYIGTS